MFATGNNLTVLGDMTRRVLRCEIDPKVERPELRTFKSDPHSIVREHRARYVVAALTILRSWIVAGRPDFPKRQSPLGGFVEWSRLVRDCLTWLGEADPCETMDATRADDPRRAQLATLLVNWAAVIGERRITAKEVIAEAVGEPTQARIALGDALAAVAASFVRAGDKIDPMRLGKYLSKHAGQVIDGYAIVKDKVVGGNNCGGWSINGSGGIVGCGGLVLPRSQKLGYGRAAGASGAGETIRPRAHQAHDDVNSPRSICGVEHSNILLCIRNGAAVWLFSDE